MKSLSAVVALVALTTGSVAQQPQVLRLQHPGRVLDAEGKPAAAAEVTFVSGPRLGGKPTDDDVVRASSGADGRFQVALVPGRSYVASALQRQGEVVQLTRYQPFGGTSTTLRLEGERRPAVTQWHVQGVEAWQQHRPLALQVLVVGSANVVAEVVVDAEGGAVVPSLPVGPVGVRLFARDRLVHVWEDAVAGCDLPLRPPELVLVRVLDAVGAPVPEATIARRWQSTPCHRVPCLGAMAQVDAWPLAVTGQDGTAQVLVAQGNPVQAMLSNGAATELSVQKEGLRLVVPPSRAGAAMQFQLGVMPGARGEVRFGKLPAQGGARFSSSGDAPWPSTFTAFDPTGGIDLVWSRRRDARTQPWRVAWITAATPELSAEDPFRAAASPHPMLVPLSRLGEEGGLDLAEVVPVRIHVLTADGMPASGADVWSVPQSDGVFAPTWQAVGRVADASGRVVVNALPGPWLVAVVHAGQLGHDVVEVAAGLRVQTLQMRTLDAVTVHVVDAEGRAVEGARVAIESDERFPRTDAREAWLQQFCANVATEQPPVATDAAGNATLQFGWREVAGCRFAIEAILGMRVARGTLEPGAASLRIVMP